MPSSTRPLYGIDSDATVDADSHGFPAGRAWRVGVYEPKYPGCDDVTITLNAASTTPWRAHLLAELVNAARCRACRRCYPARGAELGRVGRSS